MKLKNVLIALGAVLALVIVSTGIAKADGGIFPHGDTYAYETTQKAFIYYRDKTEDLVIAASYKGNASDFAWVIPTPSQPEVTKSSNQLFTDLEKITKTTNDNSVGGGIALMSGAPKGAAPVEVVSQKTIDIYDTAVLKATDAQALAKWLNDNGYKFPTDKSATLKSYVDDGWYFTAAKIQNAIAANSDVKRELTTGNIAPLRLSFKSDFIIYPMKLTRMALDYTKANLPKPPADVPANTVSLQRGPIDYIGTYSPEMKITLYVLADGKTMQSPSNLNTDWANWLSAKKLKSLNDSAGDKSWISASNKLFLTEMSQTVDLEQVNDDFIITNAPDNEVFPVPAYKTGAFWGSNVAGLFIGILISIFSPLGLLFILAVILQRYAIKKRWAYILCSIYEILVALSTLLFGLMLATLIGTDTSFAYGGLLAAILVLVTEIIFIVKMFKRMKKEKYV